MTRLAFGALALITGSMVTTPVTAASYIANPDTFATIFNNAQAGDSIKMVGNFGRTTLANKTFAVPLMLDATSATFSDTMIIASVTGLSFTGGYFGSSTHLTTYLSDIKAYSSSNLSFSKGYFVGPQGGQGLAFINSTGLTVYGSTFDGEKSGIGVVSSTGAVLDHNKSINSPSDGFDIADSHVVSITNTTCSGGRPSATAHPDCVQLFSISGHTPQSDIHATDNFAYGPTQGFTSFNPDQGGGVRIDFSRNLVQTSYPQGIACYACIDSTFIGNTLTTLPGAAHRTNINIIGGSNNVALLNTINGAAAPNDTSPLSTADLLPEIVDNLSWTPPAGSDVTKAAWGDLVASPNVASIPEPGAWAMLLAGFGITGTAARRRARYAAVAG